MRVLSLGILQYVLTGLPVTAINLSPVVLPSVLGNYRVDISSMEVVDDSRQDPYGPSPQPRRLMVSIYAPMPATASCAHGATTPYMPPSVAAFEDTALANYGVPNGTFLRPQLPVCRNGSSSLHYAHDCTKSFPLVLFSPGLGMTRLFYGALVETVASAGFAVISIDHPYDADIVAYPDGSIVLGTINGTTDAEIEQAVAVRVADTRFVLDRALAPGALPALPPLDRKKVVIFGHSLGGATAAQAIHEDRRFLGGLNLDGGLYGSVVQQGLDRPFLLFARDGHNQSTDESWAEFWSHSNGWKEQLSLLNATHGTFTDLLFLAEELGINKVLPPGALAPLLGTLEGRRAVLIIFKFVTAFFEFVLTESKGGLLRGPSKAFPEIVFSNISTPAS